MPRKLAVPTTQAGTPCARSWSGEWIAAINAIESQLNRRICGSRLPDGTPCTNESDHTSGRCKFHGGLDLTGAPCGNRNGVIHGLYSRGLRTCAPNCPYWKSCPCASPEIAALPPGKAPTCPYQLTEYNTVLTDALGVVESQPHPNSMGTHAAHNVALLHVLIKNAATQLNNGGVSPATEEQACSPNSSEASDANSRATMAFLRLMREFRAALKVLQTPGYTPLPRQKNIGAPPALEGVIRHIERAKHDTGLDPDSLNGVQLEDLPEHLHAKAYLRQSIDAASQGRDVEMAEAFDNVIYLDEHLAQSERDHVLASYRPTKHVVSEETAAQILGNLHLPPLPEPEEQDNPEQCEPKEPSQTEKFLDKLRQGKIPPEAFPIGSEIRAWAEHSYNRSSTATKTEMQTSPEESP